jgi:cathepsin B
VLFWQTRINSRLHRLSVPFLVLFRFSRNINVHNIIISPESAECCVLSSLYLRVNCRQLILFDGVGISTCPQKVFVTYPQIPTFFDARQAWPGCLAPIRNQGMCGSCWAFAASLALTDRFCIASWNGTSGTRKRLLSPQDLVDCDTNCRAPGIECNAGCQGGYLDNVWHYLQDTGVRGDSCYPYVSGTTGTATPCSPNCTGNNTSGQKYQAYSCYQLSGIQNIQSDILLYGPVMAGFNVYTDFFSYTGGVYIHTWGNLVGGHAVILIGWGVDENGTEYWLAQNQWGTSWGENGYFKIRRGTDECNIEDNVLCALPNLNSVSPEYEEYPGPAPSLPSPMTGSNSPTFAMPSQASSGTIPSPMSPSASLNSPLSQSNGQPSNSGVFVSWQTSIGPRDGRIWRNFIDLSLLLVANAITLFVM